MSASEARAVNQTERGLTSFNLQSSGGEKCLKIIFYYNSDKYAEGKGLKCKENWIKDPSLRSLSEEGTVKKRGD